MEIFKKDSHENLEIPKKNWHQKYRDSRTIGEKLSDSVAKGIGSWKFIIIQTIIVIIWMVVNVIAYLQHWDPYPFVLLNLLFSTQAAYAAPIIMMSQNRQSDRDRIQAQDDYKTNLRAKKEIEDMQKQLSRIELEKLDKIIEILNKVK